MTRCEGPGASPGQTCICPHPELKAKSCQGDIWLCSKCERARFDKDIIDIYHDAEDTNIHNEIMKVDSIIFTKSSKSYPNWPGIILNTHPNKNTCLVEFFYTKNWMLVPISNLHKFDNIESFKIEASKTKFSKEFESALNEANTYIEKMQLPISSKKHFDPNDSTRVNHNVETDSKTNLYPDLNIQDLTQAHNTDNINETPQSQELHVSTQPTASDAKNRPFNVLLSPKTIDRRKICRLFQKHKCPHGQNGNKLVDNKKCNDLHPKICQNYCKFGSDSHHGCKKGRKCMYYHPKLCRNSVKNKICLDENCSFTHLKGTLRQKEKIADKVFNFKGTGTNGVSGIRKQKESHSSSQQTENQFPTTVALSDSFLELKGLVTKMTLDLRNEINNIRSQMQMHIFQNKVPVPQTYQFYPNQAQASPNHFSNYVTTPMIYTQTHQ